MYNRKEDYFVIILGLDNAGKTTLLERIKATYSSTEKPVHQTNCTHVGTIDMNATCINFWDLGGQSELRRLWSKYYAESHAILFVVDASDSERIKEAKSIFETITATEELDGLPLLLVANKADKANSMDLAQLKEMFNPIAVNLGARDSTVLSVSALRGQGVREAVDWLAIRLERNRANRPPVLRPL
ncbi:P-loop containing nucleoside triphosphate hydrolase protein [Rhizoclosmatium globosum]|uniref:p-loop containing nucleoside triphosphate hydrolase protein n=1 Tax=Rhizoclosmatium globosum TaxID=329046 RepID=A0A1Y2B6J0_9FUNG|nr:P-loop containing nucleoside triphosphate hydrolase protein [Rhizoclosmatium globosum]|eukprot:ORY30453.1 P-loop containing nucleoside triphosphate hydrolase protein [Rhizoclosmatium globosum]